MAEKSKILIIGGTGYIGTFIVEASAKAGNPTFALVRETTVSDPVKAKLIESFKNSGVTVLHGDLHNHESLVKAIKQVDVVISTVGHDQLADQVKIIAAIKEAGTVKRFLPSEFASDVDRSNAVEPAKGAFQLKAQIRRAIEAEGIPYTYIISNCSAGSYLASFNQPGATAPPKDKIMILGDGNAKAVFNKEDDIAAFAIKAVDDLQTLNKILYIKPVSNTYSFNELVSLWEKKINKTIKKKYVPEEHVLKMCQGLPMIMNIGGLFKKKKKEKVPMNVIFATDHAYFVKGDQVSFAIDPSVGVEASQLYPDVKYTTVDEYLNQFV